MNTTESTIFMVASNTSTPGDEVIHGFYPTRQLAAARVAEIGDAADWQSEDADLTVGIQAIVVSATGADTFLTLR